MPEPSPEALAQRIRESERGKSLSREDAIAIVKFVQSESAAAPDPQTPDQPESPALTRFNKRGKQAFGRSEGP